MSEMEYIQNAQDAPTQRLASSIARMNEEIEKVNYEHHSEKIPEIRKLYLEKAKAEYQADIENELTEIEATLSKIEEKYNQEIESDNAERQARFISVDNKFKAMNDNEIKEIFMDIAYGKPKPYKSGYLDSLSIQLKERGFKKEYNDLRKAIKDKDLEKPHYHYDSIRPLYNRFKALKSYRPNSYYSYDETGEKYYLFNIESLFNK